MQEKNFEGNFASYVYLLPSYYMLSQKLLWELENVKNRNGNWEKSCLNIMFK